MITMMGSRRREDRAAYVFVFTVAKTPWANVWMCQVRRGFQACRRVRSQLALMNWSLTGPQERRFLRIDVETVVQLLTLEVLCPRARWIVQSRFPQRKSIKVWIWKVCWENHCNIMASSAMFLSPTEKVATKGCGNGSMIVCTPDGRGKVINDKRCIEHVQQVMGTTPGFNMVYDMEAYVLDVDVNAMMEAKSPKTILESLLPSNAQHIERALSQAQHEHERKRATHQDVHGENQKTFEQVKVKVPPKPYEPTKKGSSIPRSHTLSFSFLVRGLRQGQEPRRKTHETTGGHRAHSCNWVRLRVCNRQSWRSQQENLDDDCDWLDTRINLCCSGKEQGWPGWLRDTEFSNLYWQVEPRQGRVEMWPGAKYSWCGKCFGVTGPIHESSCDWDAKRFDVESTQQNIFPWSCILGLHSKTLWNKQIYCGQLQNHVRIANVRGENRKTSMLRKFSYFFMVLWYGRSCEENAWSDIVSQQTRRLNNSTKYLLHASMITSKRKIWNL